MIGNILSRLYPSIGNKIVITLASGRKITAKVISNDDPSIIVCEARAGAIVKVGRCNAKFPVKRKRVRKTLN